MLFVFLVLNTTMEKEHDIETKVQQFFDQLSPAASQKMSDGLVSVILEAEKSLGTEDKDIIETKMKELSNVIHLFVNDVFSGIDKLTGKEWLDRFALWQKQQSELGQIGKDIINKATEMMNKLVSLFEEVSLLDAKVEQ